MISAVTPELGGFGKRFKVKLKMQFIISALINSIVFSRLKLIFRISGENNFPTELLLFGSGGLAHSNYGFLFFLVEI